MDKYKIKQNSPRNFHFRGSKLNVTEMNIFYTHYEKIHHDDHAIFTQYYSAAKVSLYKP